MNATFEKYATYIIGGAVILVLTTAIVIGIVQAMHGNVHVPSDF